jgi:hypothetical protein
MIRQVVLATVAAALVLGLSGCTDATDGTAAPGGTSTTSGAPTDGPSSTESAPPDDNPLASTDPCSLLNQGSQTQLGLTSTGEPAKLGVARACKWEKRMTDLTEFFIVGILDDRGIGDLPASEALPNIGGHEARLIKGAGGSCGLSLGISETVRVDVQAQHRSEIETSCELVKQLAQLVEPELP